MKKHNERNAGRKRHGKEVKKHKSIALEPYLIEEIKADFPNFSLGIEILIKDYIARKKDLKLCE